MSEEKKQMYSYLAIGYVGILFIILTAFRVIMLDDRTGNVLALLSLLFINGFRRYVEREFIPDTKGTRIMRSIFFSLLLLIFLGGSYLIVRGEGV